jgi:hypothetical protein
MNTEVMNANSKWIILFVLAILILPDTAVNIENKQNVFFSGRVSEFSSE